jgi:UDP-glucose 4-epimerase
LAKPDQVSKLIGSLEIDTVIHAAAAVSNANDDAFARQSRSDNIDVQRIFTKAILSTHCRRFIYCSTISVYGETSSPGPGWNEADTPEPKSIYGRDKLKAERILSDILKRSRKITLVCLRFAGIHGGDRTSGVVRQLLNSALSGSALRIADANGRFRWLFVDDAVKAIELAIDADPPLHGNYNVAGADSLTLLELALAVREITNSMSEIIIERSTQGRHAVLDTSKFHKATGYTPRPLMYHLKRMIAPTRQSTA